MNFVFRSNTIMASMTMMFFIVIPRILMHYGLNHQLIIDITSGWATFAILLVAAMLFLWQKITNPKFAIIAVVIAIIGAMVLTGYFAA